LIVGGEQKAMKKGNGWEIGGGPAAVARERDGEQEEKVEEVPSKKKLRRKKSEGDRTR